MLQIWQHLCSKTKADNNGDDDEKELKLDWGSRVWQLKQAMPKWAIFYLCGLGFLLEKEELIFLQSLIYAHSKIILLSSCVITTALEIPKKQGRERAEADEKIH